MCWEEPIRDTASPVGPSTEDDCSATAGLDYVPQRDTLNFAAGETEKTILIPIIDDALMEGDETLKLRLNHPVGVRLGTPTNRCYS